MGGDESLLVGGDVLLERDGLVFGSYLIAAEGRLDLFDRDVEALRDQGQIGIKIFNLLAQEVTGDRGVVVNEQATLAIEETATRSEDGNLADTVGLGEGTEVLGTKDLESPETSDENDENERNKVLGRVKLTRRDLFGLAVGAEVIWVDMVG